MKSYMKVLAVAAVLFPLATYRAPLAAQTSLTIYNDGRVLVRRSIGAEVARGSSTVQVQVGALDPATLFSLDSSVVITAVSYDGAVDQNSVLRRAIGRKLRFRWGGTAGDTLSATVLGVDPERYLMPDGTVSFSMPGAPLFPADLVVVDPMATMTLRSSAARNALRLGYFTGGASWQANYEVILGRNTATVQGDATISNERLRLENAEVQLLAGSVSKAGGGGPQREMVMARAAAEADFASEQRVGEFHLYSLPGKTTLLPGITTSIALFDPVQAPYEKNYVVRGALPWYGILPQFPDPQDVPVEVTYTVKRPRTSDFGNRPLPGGTARLYQPDSSARLQLVGEASIDHTPAGEDLRLFAGTAFDITAKRVQTTYTTRRDSLNTWATADYSVTVTNATDSVVTVDVLEQRPGEWTVLSSSVPATKLSSTTQRFRVNVPARGQAVVTYRVRVKW